MPQIAWGPPGEILGGFSFAGICSGLGHLLTSRTAAAEKIEKLLFFQLPQFFFPLLPGLFVREPAKAQPALAMADETQGSAAVSASFVHRLQLQIEVALPYRLTATDPRPCCKFAQVRPVEIGTARAAPTCLAEQI
jgi:hypothetical protein